MKRLMSYFIVTAMMLMITACGFHLRGAGEDKVKIKDLSVTSGDRYGPLLKELREQLTDEGVKIYDTAMYRLVVNEAWDSRALAYSSSMQGTDTGRTLTLSYQIYGPQNLLLITSSVEARGQYISDTNNIVANSLQQDQLSQQVRHEAVTLLMYRLRSLSMTELESLQAKAEETKRLKEEAEKLQQKAVEERRKELQHSIPLEQIEKLNDLQ